MEKVPAGGVCPGEQLLTPLLKFSCGLMVVAGESSKVGVANPLKWEAPAETTAMS